MGLSDSIGGVMPDWGIDKAAIGKVFTGVGIFIAIVVVGIIVGIILFMYLRNKQFNKKIQIFERVNGRFEPARTISARELKFGESGDSVLMTKQGKKYLPLPKIQTGRNTYWYFISEDNEWINFGPGDFDKDRKELGGFIHDVDMRYARAELHKNFKERHQKVGWWEKYGGMIIFIMGIVIVMVFTFLIMGKALALTSSMDGIAANLKEVTAETARLLAGVDNIKGSGLIPAA